MTWLVAIGLTNALLALLLAPLALLCGRWLRRPALAHLLWIVVLCKLITPPLVRVPLDDWLGRPSGWLADAASFLSVSQRQPVDEDAAGVATASTPMESSSSPDEEAAVGRQLPASAGAGAAAEPLLAGSIREPADDSLAGGAKRRATAARSFSSTPADALRLIALGWLLGSIVVAAFMLRRGRRCHRFLKQASAPDWALQARVDQLARRAGMRSAPRLVLLENVVSPMLWGLGPVAFGRGATLAFPAPLARRLDAASCDALLLHELAHYARGDGWVRLLELIVQVLYWWHPLIWLARREIEAAEEACCDGWALEQQDGRRRLYAEALLAAVDFLHEPPLAPLPPAACGLGEAALLRWRLTQIMCGQVVAGASRRLKSVVYGAAVVVLPLSPGFFRDAAPQPAPRIEAASADMPVDPAARSPLESTRAAVRRAAAPEMKNVRRAAAPVIPRAPSTLWAVATSPNGKYQLEARTGRRTTLVHVESGWRIDLSAHEIACASFSPDSRAFATGHDDSIVRVWDSETGGLLTSLRGGAAAIASVAFAPDGVRLAAGAADGGALVWDWTQGDELARLAGQAEPVSCLRWSRDGARLAVAFGRWADADSGALALWSPDERFPPESHALAQPVGALTWLSDDSLLIAGWDGQAQYWSASTMRALGALKLDKLAVSAATWSPDCSLVAPWQSEQLVAAFDPWRDREPEPGERP